MIAEDIVVDLQGFIHQHSQPPQDWFVGLTSNPEEQLFTHHGVDRYVDAWIYRMADSAQAGRFALETCRQRECDGAAPPSAQKGNYVYAYLKSKNTNP